MRAHRTWWTRRCTSLLGHFCKRKHLDILSAPMSHPRAAKRSTCSIYPANGSKKMRIWLHGRANWATDGQLRLFRRARLPLAPRPRHCPTSVHTVDNPPGKRRRWPAASRHVLDALRSATGLLLWGNGASHVLGGKKPQLASSPVAAPNCLAHCHGPYSAGAFSATTTIGGASLAGAHEGLAQLHSLHLLSQGQAPRSTPKGRAICHSSCPHSR
jgi:hypothetical protein